MSNLIKPDIQKKVSLFDVLLNLVDPLAKYYPLPRQPRIVTAMTIFSIYTLIFLLMGSAVSALVTIPVVVTAYILGLRGGIIAGFVSIPLNTILYNITDNSSWDVIFQQERFPGMLAILLLSLLVGRMRDLEMLSQYELNQRRDAEKSLKRTHSNLQRAHNDLIATQTQLIQAEKLESVGTLAAGVAHEVKNPLSTIQLGLDFLSHQFPITDEDINKVLKNMKNAVKRADAIAKELLEFSAMRKIHMKTVQINRVIEQSLSLVKHELLKNNVTLVKELSPNLPKTKLDQNKISQVFVNLFLNACHAMPYGGTLTVSTSLKSINEDKTLSRYIKNGLFKPGDMILYTEVIDTGTGIPEEIITRIFDPFFTTKPTGQGTGLGLSVTKKIIELHEATIDITNREEGGVRTLLLLKPI